MRKGAARGGARMQVGVEGEGGVGGEKIRQDSTETLTKCCSFEKSPWCGEYLTNLV